MVHESEARVDILEIDSVGGSDLDLDLDLNLNLDSDGHLVAFSDFESDQGADQGADLDVGLDVGLAAVAGPAEHVVLVESVGLVVLVVLGPSSVAQTLCGSMCQTKPHFALSLPSSN